jgi:2-methylisocitrate lyase-like PEP mutase family enzyme
VSTVGKGKRLRELLARSEVLPVLGTPDAGTAKLMDAAGVEAAFIGTGITGGRYTGLADTGLITATEALWIGKYIANAVSFPVILDGDTGHGGPPAIRRLVQECINAGLAGIRLDDQEIEVKRGTQSEGIAIISREHAVVRYQAAVDARNEVDPDFVIMAQCYARDAINGGMEELLTRLKLYEEEGGVDWVQFESPHSKEEIVEARRAVKGPLSAMRGKLPKTLTMEEQKELGLDAAWYTGWPSSVMQAAVRAVLEDYPTKGPAVFYEYDQPWSRRRP